MRIPGPGTFIPDEPAAVGGGLMIALVIGAMVLDSFGRSGAGEPDTWNFVTSQSVCAPAVETFAEVQARARQAYDAGVPDTVENLRRLVESTGSSLLPAGARVRVLRKGSSDYSVVSMPAKPTSECWVATKSLKMGWVDWISWNWREYRKSAAAERELADMEDRIARRAPQVETRIVACSTGATSIGYTGLEVEQATPVDFSRCLARNGRVSIQGPPDGLVYYRNGAVRNDGAYISTKYPWVLFAGPSGTSVTLGCRWPLQPGESRSGTSAQTVILNLFDAFRADDWARVNEFMSSAGRDSARLFCPGKGDEAPYSCLVKNYHNLGNFTQRTSFGETSYSSATVSLKTTWTTDDGSAKELCQRFKLELIDEEWKVYLFGEPGTCGQRP